MSLILCIESSGSNCSIALFDEGKLKKLEERTSEKFTHAEDLHVFIQSVLTNEDRIPDAIAVSKGPGSYTGLRIGVSAAKGLCMAWGIPLISIGTLDSLAHYGAALGIYNFILPMLDARRMEVYTSIHDEAGKSIESVIAVVPDLAFFSRFKGQRILMIGDGASKVFPFATEVDVQLDSVVPSAMMLGAIASEKYSKGEFEDLAYFEPYYLKEFVPGISNKATT